MQISFLFADFVWQFCQHLWNRNTCLLWIKAAHGAAVCLLILHQWWAEKWLVCGVIGTCATHVSLTQSWRHWLRLPDTKRQHSHPWFLQLLKCQFFNYWDPKPAGKKNPPSCCELFHCCWFIMLLHVFPLSITSALKNKMAWGFSDLCPNLPVICCGLKERKQKAVTLARSK